MHEHVARRVRRADLDQLHRLVSDLEIELARKGARGATFLDAGKVEHAENLGIISASRAHARRHFQQLRKQSRVNVFHLARAGL